MKNNPDKKKKSPVRKTASTNISTTPEVKRKLLEMAKHQGLNASALVTTWINAEHESWLDRKSARNSAGKLESVDCDDKSNGGRKANG